MRRQSVVSDEPNDDGAVQSRAARWSLILDQLATHQKLSVTAAAELLGVSESTVRRDFRELAERQLANRHHGGVVASSVAYELPYRYRSNSADEAHSRLAKLAAGLLKRTDSVIALNGGTTTTATARAISAKPRDPRDGALTIVTNALNIANEVVLRPHVRCISLGGVARPESYEVSGAIAMTTLGHLWFDVTIFGVNGLTVPEGPTCGNDDEALIVRTMLERSRSSICVADATKVGIRSLTSICPPGQLTHVVTTAGADPSTVKKLRENGVTVHFA